MLKLRNVRQEYVRQSFIKKINLNRKKCINDIDFLKFENFHRLLHEFVWGMQKSEHF